MKVNVTKFSIRIFLDFTKLKNLIKLDQFYPLLFKNEISPISSKDSDVNSIKVISPLNIICISIHLCDSWPRVETAWIFESESVLYSIERKLQWSFHWILSLTAAQKF